MKTFIKYVNPEMRETRFKMGGFVWNGRMPDGGVVATRCRNHSC